ncbi:MAG TPA: hypothetical protein VJZ31_00405 [Bacilli bacterium]|nr:hypothetical protein [Bacilli bacterium]
MFLKRPLRLKIEQELELHFLFNRLILEDEVMRLEKEVKELDRNLTMNAKVQNLLNIAKQTHENFDKAREQLSIIEKESLDAGFKDFTPERLERVAKAYTKDDEFFENRIIFAIKFIFSLPSKPSSACKKQTFTKISTLLGFPRPNALNEIETSLKNNYKDISLTNKIDVDQLIKVGIISSLVVAGLVSVVTLPFIGFGAGATIGGAIASNIITTTSISLASGIAASGILLINKSKANDLKILEEFNNLTPDELSYMLTFNATLINYMRRLGVAAQSSAIKKRLDMFVKLSNQINVDFYLKQQQIETNGQKKKIMAKCDQILLNQI